MEKVRISRHLIEKYNRPGPRYTSYPTAIQFQPVSDPRDLMADSLRSTGPLSLYFHLPFCESLCWFCACAKEITTDSARADRYLDAIEKELELTSPYLDPQREVTQLHYGGGSPSFLSPAQLRRLTQAWRSRFAIHPDAEISVELDPRTLSEEKVEALAEGGFRRGSFGVQDVDPEVQKAVHRVQPSEVNRRSLKWLREAGFDSINVDLIYGLPNQTADTFRATLEEVLSYSPDRLAIFSYAHVPWVAPAQKILERKALPGAESKIAMLEMIVDVLQSAGYQYIGMDHFAKTGDSLAIAQRQGALHRNFQGYSTQAGLEIAAFGMSAISQTAHTYRQNEKDLDHYYALIEKGSLPIERGYQLTPEDLLRRKVIMEIMCQGGIDFDEASSRLNIDFRRHFEDEIASLHEPANDGLLELNASGFNASPAGRLLIRNIAMHFDAHLAPAAERRHAKTI